MVRPERISVSFEKQKNRLIEMPATITEVSYAGHALRLKAAVFKGEWIIQAPDPQFPRLPKAGIKCIFLWIRTILFRSM